jgi:hypothetical protein
VFVCTPYNEHRLLFQMLHGSFGTLGILSKLTFRLIAAKPYVRVAYEQYATLGDYKAAIWRRFVDQDVDVMDGFIHTPAQSTLCLGRFVDEAPYTSLEAPDAPASSRLRWNVSRELRQDRLMRETIRDDEATLVRERRPSVVDRRAGDIGDTPAGGGDQGVDGTGVPPLGTGAGVHVRLGHPLRDLGSLEPGAAQGSDLPGPEGGQRPLQPRAAVGARGDDARPGDLIDRADAHGGPATGLGVDSPGAKPDSAHPGDTGDRRVDHAGHGSTTLHESDHDRELAVAPDELLGAVERIHEEHTLGFMPGLRYLRRIRVDAACLACHGPKDRRPEFVEQRYPDDRAYDFDVGDLRGLYSVFIPDGR